VNRRLPFVAVVAALMLVHPAATAGTIGRSSVPHRCDRTWTVVPSIDPGTSTELNGVAAISPTDVWAVGDGVGGAFTEHWDGNQWSFVRVPVPPSRLSALQAVDAVSAVDVWAVGWFYAKFDGQVHALVEHWDGAAWTLVPLITSRPEPQLWSVYAGSSSDVWAAGYGDSHNGLGTFTAHWNGTRWRAVPNPLSDAKDALLFGVSGTAQDDVWTVGYGFQPHSSGLSAMSEHWDGFEWTLVPAASTPYSSPLLLGASEVSGSDVWAVGYASVAHDITLAEHWDGSGWNLSSTPNPDQEQNRLNGVAAISTGDVWAVGGYRDASQRLFTLTEHWDGANWTIVPSPNSGDPANRLVAVSADSPGDVWAVGWSQDTALNFHTLVEHYC
jgi:hypothetical protein